MVLEITTAIVAGIFTIIGASIGIIGIYINGSLEEKRDKEKRERIFLSKIHSFFFGIYSITSRLKKGYKLTIDEKKDFVQKIKSVKEILPLAGVYFQWQFRDILMDVIEKAEKIVQKNINEKQITELSDGLSGVLENIDKAMGKFLK